MQGIYKSAVYTGCYAYPVPRVRQLYRLGSLNLPGHPVTAAVFSTTMNETRYGCFE